MPEAARRHASARRAACPTSTLDAPVCLGEGPDRHTKRTDWGVCCVRVPDDKSVGRPAVAAFLPPPSTTTTTHDNGNTTPVGRPSTSPIPGIDNRRPRDPTRRPNDLSPRPLFDHAQQLLLRPFEGAAISLPNHQRARRQRQPFDDQRALLLSSSFRLRHLHRDDHHVLYTTRVPFVSYIYHTATSHPSTASDCDPTTGPLRRWSPCFRTSFSP